MRLTVTIPSQNAKSLRYVMTQLLADWLGLNLEFREHQSPETIITAQGKQLILHDFFFSHRDQSNILRQSLMNPRTLEHENTRTPLFFSQPGDGTLLISTTDTVELFADLPGSVFFLLTGYEQVLNDAPDRFGRQKAANSLLKDYLHRPLVNEYLELLVLLLNHLWPGLAQLKREFRVIPTHDVDHPYKHRNLRRRFVYKNIFGDILLRRQSPFERIAESQAVHRGKTDDPYDTFDWILETEREYQRKAVYYFFAGELSSDNPDYRIADAPVRKLLQKVKSDGHIIGIHAGLGSRDSQSQLENEVREMQKVGVDVQHVRQHYLSFHPQKTWPVQAAVGLMYDSSSAYSDAPGFRNGTCFPFRVFDLFTERELDLVEEPLVLMEGTLLDPQYLGLDFEQAGERIAGLKQTVQKHHGDFRFLWHNHRLTSQADRELFKMALA